MNNIIIKNLIDDFVKQQGGIDASDEDKFALFCNYSIIASEYPGMYDIDIFDTGGCHDTGIDGVACAINDRVIESQADFNDIYSLSKKIEAHFMFIQSKTSQNIDSGGLSKFINGVRNFFANKPLLQSNERIDNLIKLKDAIYSNAIDMIERPVCSLYYAYPGKWSNIADHIALIEQAKQDLYNLNLFSLIEFKILDAEAIASLYRSMRGRVKKQVKFKNYTTVPEIENVDEAFIGLIQGDDFISLIKNEDDKIDKNIFYDNVRDFQGDNSVNIEINDTLKSDNKNKFALLNNGITIVAQKINRISDNIILTNFQIVNGCQTSHILFKNKSIIGQQVYIPVKIIATQHIETVNSIIRATNRQTEVKNEAFESLTQFHKNLEAFYVAAAGKVKNKIYYERRSKQYIADETIFKHEVISLAAQIKCYLAMFLHEPHSTHRYYGELLKSYKFDKKRIFQTNHSYEPYFASAYCLSQLTKFLLMHSKYKHLFKYKYHILLFLKILFFDGGQFTHGSHKENKKCFKLTGSIDDNNVLDRLCSESITLFEKIKKKYNFSNYQLDRKAEFTKAILNEVKPLSISK